MSEWKEYRLSDITSIENKRRIPLNSRQRSEIQGNFPYYGASGVVDYVNDYIFDGQYVLISEDGENLRSRQTPIAFLVDGQFWVNNHAHILKGDDELVNEFIVYYFQNLNINPFITGAVQPKLNLENLLSIPIFMPDREERLELTRLLSSLTRKIENLRKQNETLEKIAQTLFKHWFVDFEFPNEDGKPYKSSGGDMVRSELGEIPAGWQVGELGNIGKNIRDGISEDEIQPDMNYIALEHMPRKQIALDSWDTAADIASNKFIFKKGNILFGKLRPYFHKVGIAFISGICSTDILVLDSKRKDLFSFLLMVLSSDEFIKYVTLASEGTRMPRTSWEYMKEYPIYIPDNSVVSAFNDLVKASTNKIENNVFQIQTLTQIRDVLLPKLMSGKLRITAS